MQINPNLFPAGGFWFQDADGAKIFADTWAGVVARVIAYRARANYPPGNPEAEVTAQACKRNPGLCQETDATYQAQLAKSSLKTRVLMWLSLLVQSKSSTPIEFVPESEARERARSCAGCPFNLGLSEGCSSCRMALEEARRAIIGGRAWDARLSQCALLGEDLNTSVWMERQRLADDRLPGHCWMKRTV
jgi:hypothetical protein